MNEISSSFFKHKKKTISDLEKMRKDTKTPHPMKLKSTILPPPKLVPTNINEIFIRDAAIRYFGAYQLNDKEYIPNEQIDSFKEYLINCRRLELEKYYEDLNQERDDIEFKLFHPSRLYDKPKPTIRPAELYSYPVYDKYQSYIPPKEYNDDSPNVGVC